MSLIRENFNLSPRNWRQSRLAATLFLFVSLLEGCGSAKLVEGGTLSNYDGLTASNGLRTKSLIKIDKQAALAAKTVKIMPVVFPPASLTTLSEKQRELVANAADRSLCIGLSDRFQVVAADQPADLTVRAFVVKASETNKTAAGVSKVASFVPTVLSLGVPVRVPRLPIGLGALTVEGEATTGGGGQVAAFVWARGADSFTSSPKVSTIGDAYDLATAFGSDFSRLLVSGASPYGKLPTLPTMQKIGSSIGGKAKYAACEAFGRAPGIKGMVGGKLGLPPEWTDTSTESTTAKK